MCVTKRVCAWCARVRVQVSVRVRMCVSVCVTCDGSYSKCLALLGVYLTLVLGDRIQLTLIDCNSSDWPN